MACLCDNNLYSGPFSVLYHQTMSDSGQARTDAFAFFTNCVVHCQHLFNREISALCKSFHLPHCSNFTEIYFKDIRSFPTLFLIVFIYIYFFYMYIYITLQFYTLWKY